MAEEREQAGDDDLRPPTAVGALPALYDRSVLVRLTLLAVLVLVGLIGCIASDEFVDALGPVPVPVFAAVGVFYLMTFILVLCLRSLRLRELRRGQA